MSKVVSVLQVKFKSSLDQNGLMTACQNGLKLFRTVPGLVQKYYIAEEETGAISGFYLFTTRSAREAFWTSELASKIPATYGVIPETVRIERYEMALMLNEGIAA